MKYLATTAITEFWNITKPILFLGEWCYRYQTKETLNKLSYTTLDYPWDDVKRKKASYDYSLNVYNVIMLRMTHYLNNKHHVDFSQRYWQIVIGEWLWRYIQVVYDRYITLMDVLNQKDKIDTQVLPNSSYRIPKDNLEFISLIGDDTFNLQLYSQILSELGFTFKSGSILNNKNNKKKIDKYLRKIGINIISILSRLIYKIAPKQINVFCGFSTTKKIMVSLLFSNIYRNRLILFNDMIFDCGVSIESRNEFAEMSDNDPFIDLCLKMMLYQFPKAYIEGYRKLRKTVHPYVNNKVKYIFSKAGWRFDVVASFYIAEIVENGGKLIGCQHGGGYGLYDMDSMLWHELKVTDKFISWGWKENNKKVISLPEPILSELKGKFKRNIKGQILYVGNSCLPYHDVFQSSPTSSQFLNYLSWQVRFFNSINDNLKNKVLVRLYPVERGWSNKERLESEIKNLNYDDYVISFNKRLKKTKVVVVDNNQTVYLKTMAFNIPTIIFWNSSIWTLSQVSQTYFDKLKAVKIFHDTPESAANFLNTQIDTIYEWWFEDNVQEVVQEFCYNYARTSQNWKKKWKEAIL